MKLGQIILISILIIGIVAVSGCVGDEREPVEKRDTINIRDFTYTYRLWNPGNSGDVITEMIEFRLKNQKILIVARNGDRDRNLASEEPVERVSQGVEIGLHENFSKLNQECELIQGNPPICEYFYGSACIMSCSFDLEIKVNNKSKLKSCLSDKNFSVSTEIIPAEQDFNKSKCLFFNGEGLALKKQISSRNLPQEDQEPKEPPRPPETPE